MNPVEVPGDGRSFRWDGHADGVEGTREIKRLPGKVAINERFVNESSCEIENLFVA
jgi:hypothetical protein